MRFLGMVVCILFDDFYFVIKVKVLWDINISLLLTVSCIIFHHAIINYRTGVTCIWHNFSFKHEISRVCPCTMLQQTFKHNWLFLIHVNIYFGKILGKKK